MAIEDLLLIAIAFLPPIAYLVWVRNLEIRDREPWGQVVKMFVWGATGGVFLAFVFSYGLFDVVGPFWDERIEPATLLEFAVVTAFVIAPFAEEPAKALGLTLIRDDNPEPEDGLVYGAAVGLGFASTENLLYGASALTEGGIGALLLIGGIRAFASAFLHASASALVGYGFLRTGIPARRLAFLGLAILLHGAYNFFLSVNGVLSHYMENATTLALIAFLGALAMSVATFKIIRRQVQKLDAAAPP